MPSYGVWPPPDVTVQDVYDQVCFALLEPGGLRLGLVTQAQFLQMLAVAMTDFAQQAPLDKKIFTTMINADVGEYVSPDDIMVINLCFVAGRIINQVAEADLARGHANWRAQEGTPRQWHDDNLEVKHFEVMPKPDFNGANIPGDPPPIGKYGDFFPTERNLTIVGPSGPAQTSWGMGDTLTGVPPSFSHYIVFRVLEQVFSAEGETRDVQRAAYCHARFAEGVALADAIAREELLEEDDDRSST